MRVRNQTGFIIKGGKKGLGAKLFAGNEDSGEKKEQKLVLTPGHDKQEMQGKTKKKKKTSTDDKKWKGGKGHAFVKQSALHVCEKKARWGE